MLYHYYIKYLQIKITVLQKQNTTLLATNNKLKNKNKNPSINTIISKSQVKTHLPISTTVYIKHKKSFSNLATYLALEQCSIPDQSLTDDEIDE